VDTDTLGTLYSFRRCPYAMRARMALEVSGVALDLVEVSLKDKPARMLELSPKGTVPVIELRDGTVIDESLDIMLWALDRSDPEGWLGADEAALEEMIGLIARNDGEFKTHLDRTKYALRYEGVDPEHHRGLAQPFLDTLSGRLEANAYLMGPRPSLADWAIFPFIRQFANIDRTRFDATTDARLQVWLDGFLGSGRFSAIMQRGSRWAQ